ncbi:MAG: cytochrome c biogenesis protein DipZ [Candidatus Doudnabacteria bacterium]|nr:cytochrome c biogenesis protein DipZ [Candidatus Doudnabacteria bacterium]
MLQLLLALIAGILTIAAPCILLPLPILLGASVGQTHRLRPLFITLGFVTTFSILGISLNVLVQRAGVDPNTLRTIAVVVLTLFAGSMIWPKPFELLTAHLSGLITSASQAGQRAGSGNFGGFVMGVIIGIVWAPCAGPILGSILTLIAQESNTVRAFGLLLAYAVGAGIPMLLIAYGGQALTQKVRFLAQYSSRLQQVFGIVLLLVAASIYFQYDTKIQALLVRTFPVIGTNLETKIKDSLEQQSPTPTPSGATLSAPNFTGIATWLNTEKPVSIADLKGKVVLVDFWTYSCINCVRTLPYITQWYDTYKDKGLVVIGVHTPEFAFEKNTDNVRRALAQHGITYPVALDNSYGTWQAYQNQYWPAKYLVDQSGNIVYTHFGEGAYTETENKIRGLLGMDKTSSIAPDDITQRSRTPEIYFGTDRLEYFAYNTRPATTPAMYVIPNRLDLDHFALAGTWQFSSERTTLTKAGGTIKLHFRGKTVYMVAASPSGAQSITIRSDDGQSRAVQIQEYNLYPIYSNDAGGEHVIEISIPEAGFEAYTFTFG